VARLSALKTLRLTFQGLSNGKFNC
jgi:hypothetical protein